MATAVAVMREPFAPLRRERLQHLNNRQNLISPLSTSTKRKAASFDYDEAIDPVQYLKKFKFLNGSSIDGLQKTANVCFTKAAPSPNDSLSALKPILTSPRRPILPTRSPASTLNTISKSNSLTAPAGRSPTQKQTGGLNRRKRASPLTRIHGRQLGASSDLGFSINAVLLGTISRCDKRHASSREQELPVILDSLESRDPWPFDIHEDTTDELTENLINHSVCTLDIGSDEESAAEMDKRGKENVPPLDDISQTRSITVAKSLTVDVKPQIDTGVCHWREIGGADDGIDRIPLCEITMEGFPR